MTNQITSTPGSIPQAGQGVPIGSEQPAAVHHCKTTVHRITQPRTRHQVSKHLPEVLGHPLERALYGLVLARVKGPDELPDLGTAAVSLGLCLCCSFH